MNCACCITTIGMMIVFGQQLGKNFITFCIFISQMNMAYNDTVTDALTCQAAKFGVKDGNENLNAISYLFQGIGAIVGAFISMQVKESKHFNPYSCFGVYMLLQFFFFVSALMMNKDMEPGEIEEKEQESIQAAA